MFSGTTFVQDIRANRPIRLTRDLNQRGIPVFSSITTDGGREARPEYRMDYCRFPSTSRLAFILKSPIWRSNHVKSSSSPPPSQHPEGPLEIQNKGWTPSTMSGMNGRNSPRWVPPPGTGNPLNDTSPPQWMLSRPFHGLAEKMNRYEPLSPTVVVPSALTEVLQPDYEHAPAEAPSSAASAISPRVGSIGTCLSCGTPPEHPVRDHRASEPEGLTFPNNVNLGPRSHPEINSIAAMAWGSSRSRSPLSDAVDDQDLRVLRIGITRRLLQDTPNRRLSQRQPSRGRIRRP